MLECRHIVSPAADKPALSLYFVREPHRSWHLTWFGGTCDDPDHVRCTEFGPFDSAPAVADYVRSIVEAWCVQSGAEG